jgi:catechol 2,3-dioxygenase-like lactoylglutathione lyase family enzyme
MKIEHIGFNVKEPQAAADWYVANLGMNLVKQGGPPTYGRFLADGPGQTVLEFYRNDKAPIPDYAATDPITLHVAIVSSDVRGDRKRLITAGATPAGEATVTPEGDELAVVRDPWGLAIQLARRGKPLS